MSFNTLPPMDFGDYKDLETLAVEERERIVAELDLHYMADNGRMEPTYDVEVSTRNIFDRIARIIYIGCSERLRIEGAFIAQRAFSAGLVIGSAIVNDEYCKISVEEFGQETGVVDYINSVPAQFLNYRPNVDELVGRYLPGVLSNIDKDSEDWGFHYYCSEQIGGLVLAQIHQARIRQFSEQQLQDLSELPPEFR